MKKILKILRLQIKGGLANPAPPIGPVCGAAGINIMEFCKKFNSKTKDKSGQIFPVIIHVYDDKSFDFIIKKPPVSVQLMEISNIKKGSKEPNRIKVAKIDWKQVRSIAENKISDLNCFSIETAMSLIAGTARSMGIEIINNEDY